MKLLVQLLVTSSSVWFGLQISGCATTETRIATELEAKLVQLPKYNRKLYKHWVDEDGDCQNTRAEVLIATSRTKPKFKTKKQCVVVSGTWFDPYSGQTITTARKLDIDHVISLHSAHVMGAGHWNKKKRELFANDIENLIPVSLRLNRQKGSKSPNQWLPPNRSYQCEYIKRWILVQQKYGLAEPRGPASTSVNKLKDVKCIP